MHYLGSNDAAEARKNTYHTRHTGDWLALAETIGAGSAFPRMQKRLAAACRHLSAVNVKDAALSNSRTQGSATMGGQHS